MAHVTILDGGTGVLLPLLGMPKDPLIWSARALVDDNLNSLVVQAHEAYLKAGATAIITNTYSITPVKMRKAGFDDNDARRLCSLAAHLARQAVGPKGEGKIILGSLPPLVESFRNELLLPETEAQAWYELMSAAMAPDVDIFLCETMSCPVEATMALQGLMKGCPGAKAWVSFTVDSSGCCRDGTTFNETVKKMSVFGDTVAGIGVNCCIPEAVELAFETVDKDEEALRFALGVERVVYANAYPSTLNEGVKFSTETFNDEELRDDLGAERYANIAQEWATRPVLPITVIGGCCGILPEHIQRLAATVKPKK